MLKIIMKSEVSFQRENLVWNHDHLVSIFACSALVCSELWNCDCPLLPNISYPLMYSSRITLPNDESVKKTAGTKPQKSFYLQDHFYKALWSLSESSGQTVDVVKTDCGRNAEIWAFDNVVSTWLFILERSGVRDKVLLLRGTTLFKSKWKKLPTKSISRPI